MNITENNDILLNIASDQNEDNMINLSRTSKEQFDRQAAHYDIQWSTWSQATLDWMLNNSDADINDKVLDVATGSGYTALAFAPKVREVIGSDVSTGMLGEAAKKAVSTGLTNISFVEAAAENLLFDNDSFNIVTCRLAAHHFLQIDSFAAEARRVLKTAGRLVIADTSVPDSDFLASIWQNETERLRDPSHVKNYSVREWMKILEKSGFDVVRITDTGDGIRIPLSTWIEKAGCTPDQAAAVQKRFQDAPENVRQQFKIVEEDGDIYFTWLRVLIKAVKPV